MTPAIKDKILPAILLLVVIVILVHQAMANRQQAKPTPRPRVSVVTTGSGHVPIVARRWRGSSSLSDASGPTNY